MRCAAALILLGLTILPPALAGDPPIERYYEVVVETGTRAAPGGASVDYALYIPQPTPSLPAPPWPAIVLTHGFGRDFGRHLLSAVYLAEHGAIVMTPNMLTLIGGDAAQERNIALTADHVAWLLRRNSDHGDPLFALIDTHRIGLAGHSAGAAVSLEAALALQERGTPAAAICLLDAVPWQRTLRRAAALGSSAVISLRSEPAVCNARGAAVDLTDALRFPHYDLKIRGATHCDPESPTDATCRIACGGGSIEATTLYRDLTYAFFRDSLNLPVAELPPESLAQALLRLTRDGRIEVRETPSH